MNLAEWQQLFPEYTFTRVKTGESGAKVFRCEQAAGRPHYLKYGKGQAAGGILDEVVRLQWLQAYLPCPRVLHFQGEPRSAWMLTSGLPGRSAYECLNDGKESPIETVRAIADFLRQLHSLPAEECPFLADHHLRLVQARRNMAAGIVDTADFDVERQGWSAEQVWAELQTRMPRRMERVVTHGDFSLDNVFLQRGRVTGVIDVGRLGIADPYQDLAILWNNLAEFGEGVQRAFLQAYGLRRLDQGKLAFHLCLDELF